MRKFLTLMSVAVFGVLSSASQAIVIDITSVWDPIAFAPTQVTVDSLNTNSGKALSYVLNPNFDTNVEPTAVETNIGAGNQTLQFGPATGFMGANGTYNFTGPELFSYYIHISDSAAAPFGPPFKDLLVHAEVFNTPGTGGVTVTGISALNPQGNRSGGVSVKILDIDGDATIGAFSTGEAAVTHNFDYFGTPLTILIRQLQSPSVSATGNTAIEGRILGVPEPTSLALFFSVGVCGSLVVIRRRRA